MDNKTSPQHLRDGFRYPRLDARLHHGDKVRLSSTSHKTWLYIPKVDPASPSFRTFRQTTDPDLASTFAIERASIRSPVVSLWCMGEESYVSVRASDGAVGCFSASPAAFSYVRIDGQKWWDASRGSLQDPATGRFLRVEAPGPAGSGKVTMLGSDAGGWQLLAVTLMAGYETVFPLIRGVNLGNWFVLERWMSGELFVDDSGKPFQDRCAALDERGLMERLSPEIRRSRMEKHWSEWITEPDIRWLAGAGINTVRVPFGYWMTHPEPPFIDGQFFYLKKLFRWCAKYKVAILLDFHGLKGSQNGVDSSGNCGACGQAGCGTTNRRFLERKERHANLAVIANLSATFAQESALLGFGLANEVQACDRYELMLFYQMAFDLIRTHSPEALVVVGGLFAPSTYPFLREAGMVQDEHMYFSVIAHRASADHRANIGLAMKHLNSQPRWPVLVGEWSLDHSGFELERLTLAEQERWLRTFAKAQLQAYEQHSMGWIYWNYKVGVDVSQTWSFKAMCKRGFLPGCVPGFNYGPPNWWLDSSTTLAYFDLDQSHAVVGDVKVGPFIVGKAGTNACPTGSEMLSEEECRQMPKEFGGSLHQPFSVKFNSDPKGCFKFQGNYYYNTHPTGGARDERWPHCKLTCPPDYVAGKNGANECPEGTVALTKGECEDILKDLGKSLFGGEVHDEAAPAGCYRFGARLYFNAHPKGAERIGRTPYCRRTCTIQYVVSEDGASECPSGSVKLNEKECHGAVGLLGAANGPFGESKSVDPSGCFRYQQGFYFNKHPHGKARGNRTLVCKKTSSEAKHSHGRLSLAGAARWSTPEHGTHPPPPPLVAPPKPTTTVKTTTSLARTTTSMAKIPDLLQSTSWLPPATSTGPRSDFSGSAAGSTNVGGNDLGGNDLLGHDLVGAMPAASDVEPTPSGGDVIGGTYISGDPGTNSCPEGTMPLTSQECYLVPQEFGMGQSRPYDEDVPGDPTGCFSFENKLYYNKHQVGAPREMRIPLCKHVPAQVEPDSSWEGTSGTAGTSLRPEEPAVASEGHSAVPSVFNSVAAMVGNKGSFIAGNSGTNGCPPNSAVLDQDDCAQVSKEYGDPSRPPSILAENSAEDPRGCFQYEQGFYFNTHPVGSPRLGRKPYCRRSAAQGPQKQTAMMPKVGEPFARSEGLTIHGSYVPGDPGSNSCPPGAVGLSELECKSLPEAFTGRTHDPFVEYLGDDPRGCFKYEHGFYFNKHPIGTPRPGRTPYCKRPSTTLFE